jgi:hypothetical protein
MYNYHTSVVISKYVFRLKKKIFCFQNALGYWWHCNFYSAGVVTHDRRIGSSRDASFSEILSDLAFSFFTLVTCEKQNKLKSEIRRFNIDSLPLSVDQNTRPGTDSIKIINLQA